MKAFTKNLLLFSIGLTILTVLLRYSLSTMLQNRYFTVAWMIVILYAILVFVMGRIFGKRDYQTLPLYDIGFRFHLSTYIICNLIAEFWFFLGLQSDYETTTSVHLTALFWGIGLLIHFIIYLFTRKNAINGIEKSEIFE
jgi:hypothetical protein